MNCVFCGAEMEIRHETRRYDIGLDEPVIIEGAEVAHCSGCGEEMVGIRQPESIHRYVAERVACKRARLTPREVRFLRTHLGYCSVDFARAMGVAPETVSRWERVDKPKEMSPVAERLLRVLVLTQDPRRRYPLEQLGTENASPLKIRLLPIHDRWVAADDPDIPSALAQAPGEYERYLSGTVEQVDALEVRAAPGIPQQVEPSVDEKAA